MTKKKLFAGLVATLFAVALVVPTGAGAATAEELRAQIQSLQDELADLQSQLSEVESEEGVSAACPAECADVSFDRNLYLGSRGDDVKCLQAFLNEDGDTQLAETGAGSPGNETSYFGPITKAAVVAFQEAYSADVLEPLDLPSGTGYFWPSTRAKANELLTDMCAAEEEPAEEEPAEEEGEGTDEGEGMLDVSVSDDTAESTTVLADSTGSGADGAQSMVPFVTVEFENNGDSDTEVTELSFTRTGIASDNNLSQLYLYEGDTKLAEYSSFNDKVLTFESSSGLFEVGDGDTVEITLKGDIANDTGPSKTIGFKLASADDVASDADSVSGDFPVEGNTMTTATVDGLGMLSIENVSPSSATSVDPGQENYDLWEFKLTAESQDMEVSYLKFTNVGSIDDNDLQNLMLTDVGGTQYGETADELDSNEVEFDLSGDPIELTAGESENFYLKGDIVGGTNRDFRFSVQSMTDIVAYDTEYGVYVKPDQSDSWTIDQAGGKTSINSGSMIISRASDSPSGNVALDDTNATLAKFDLTASGENVKVSSFTVQGAVTNSSGGDSDDGLQNVKVYLDGSQKDTTADTSSETLSLSFGNTFVVKAGEASTLTVKADVKDEDGDSFDSGDTIQVSITSISATGKTSMQSVSVSNSDAHVLTVQSGSLTAAANNAMPNATSTSPTGVAGATDALVASFVATAGSGEGVDVTTIKLADTSPAFTNVQNVKVKLSDGTQIGNTKSSVTTGSTYTFYADPDISLDAGEQVVLNVYADISSNATSGAKGSVDLNQVAGVGQATSSSTTTSSQTGQTIYVLSNGSLTVSKSADMPIASMLRMSTSNNELAEFEFYETSGAENVTVSDITLDALVGAADDDDYTDNSAGSTSDILNVDIYDGDTLIATDTDVSSSGEISFSGLSWTIPASTEKYLTVKTDVNQYGVAGSDKELQIQLDAANNVTARGSETGSTLSLSGTSKGNNYEVWKAVPTITTSGVSLDGGTLTNGTNNLYKFQVSAEGGTVDFYQWKFKVSTTDVNAAGTWKLRNNTGGYYVDSGCSMSGTTLTCQVKDSNSQYTTGSAGEEVAAGSTETFTLSNSNITGVDTNSDSISIYLKSDTDDEGSLATNSSDFSDDNIIWSDEATTSHGFGNTGSSDWTNGYLLENDDEYTTPQTVSD